MKAVGVLFGYLGFSNFIFFINPKDGGAWEDAYYFINAILQSSQVNHVNFLLNGVLVYLLSTMTLLSADCLTPIQLLERSECYLYNYHSAVVISNHVWNYFTISFEESELSVLLETSLSQSLK